MRSYRSSYTPIKDETLEQLRDIFYAHRIGDMEMQEILAAPEKVRQVARCIRGITHSVDRTKREIVRAIHDGVAGEDRLRNYLLAQGFPQDTIDTALGKLKLTSQIVEHNGELFLNNA